MPVIKHSELKQTPVDMDGAKAVTKKIPVGAKEGWDGYTMRVFTISPGGFTPKHSHDWEHVNHIVRGRGKLMINGAHHDMNEKDFALVPPNTEHQFSNPYDKPFEFICIVPNRGEY